jgi:hypothetical protein
MRRLGILGVTTVAVALLACNVLAQRGGAVRGGMRGAVVGGMVGGRQGAATGAKVGVVTGATRAAINRETQARTDYEATTEYQNAQRSNFNEAPPEACAGSSSPWSRDAVGGLFGSLKPCPPDLGKGLPGRLGVSRRVARSRFRYMLKPTS